MSKKIPRIISVGEFKAIVGCGNEVERGAYTFRCGTKTKAGNYQYCHNCSLNKKILDGERAKTSLFAIQKETAEVKKNG